MDFTCRAFLLHSLKEGGGRSCSSFPRLLLCDFCLELFLQEFSVSFVGTRSVKAMVEEFLLHPPFKHKWGFLWKAGACAIVCIWGERNERV